jgi:uncharacterized protein YndB with AHSA1/START domain
MSKDRVEQDIVISAPIERVWAVLTEGEHVGQWFGQGKPTDIDLRPGGTMVLDHGQYGTFLTRIEKVERPHAFSYRWASAYPGEEANEGNSTLVEFTLREQDGGTHLHVTESGFAALSIPAEKEPTAGYDSHNAGWVEKIAEVGQYAERLPA